MATLRKHKAKVGVGDFADLDLGGSPPLIPGPEGDAPVRPPEVDKAVTEPAGKPQALALSRRLTQRTIVLAVAQFAFLGLLCVSVDHMVLTLAKITNASQWQAWTTAIVIDIVYVVLEWMGLIADEGERQRLRWWTTPTIIATMAFSAGSNAFAFTGAAPDGWWSVGAAILLGFYIPTLLYVLAKCIGIMWNGA
jgi:hypothetical protein